METVHDWNEKIMLLIEKLKKDHPELVGFLDEMNTTLPNSNDPKITIGTLKDYFDSLMNLEILQKK
jgi:hypothetical protein